MNIKFKKILKIIAVVIFVLLFVASFLLGTYTAKSFLSYNNGNDTKKNSIKQLEIWNYDLESFQNKWKSEDIILDSYDNEKIFLAKYNPQDTPKGYVILVHGFGGDHVSVSPLAEIYLENGYTVLALDQRTSGNSTVSELTFGYREKYDIETIVDYIKLEEPQKAIILHGQSMGGATSILYAATEHGQKNLDFLLVDSSYDNMKNMCVEVMVNLGLGKSEAEYSSFFANIYLKLFEGFSFSDTDIIKKSQYVNTPTLIIQSKKDELAPIEVGEKIFSSINNQEKEYVLFESNHIEGVIDFPDEYETAILSFVEK